MTRHKFGILAILVAGAALGLTIVPRLALPADSPTLTQVSVAAIVLAAIGLVAATLAYRKEKEPILLGVTLALGTIAIIWQYVLIGIVVAIIAAVVLSYHLRDWW